MAVNHKENQSHKGRFNALDAFIILLVILCVVGIYFRSNIASWINGDKELSEYQVSFKVTCIKSTSGKYLTPGGVVYMSNGLTFGTLKECASLPAKAIITDNEGNLKEVSYPKDTYIDLSGVITVKGVEKDDGFYLGGTYLLTAGANVSVYTDAMDFTLTVSEISRIK